MVYLQWEEAITLENTESYTPHQPGTWALSTNNPEDIRSSDCPHLKTRPPLSSPRHPGEVTENQV